MVSSWFHESGDLGPHVLVVHQLVSSPSLCLLSPLRAKLQNHSKDCNRVQRRSENAQRCTDPLN